ncbi:MAG: hypothetical protein ACTHOJ_04610 [Sphingomonas oligoaromativorans]
MKITADEYEQFRRWLAIISPIVFAGMHSLPEASPIVVLDHIAMKSPARARQGLEMAIGDIIEATNRWDSGRLAEIEANLAGAGLPTFHEVRLRFSRGVQAILKRGRIANEREYHTVRNAVEGLEPNEDQMWAMLSAYEATVVD